MNPYPNPHLLNYGPPTPKFGVSLHVSLHNCTVHVNDLAIYPSRRLQPEPVFVNLLRSPGIYSQSGGPVARQAT
jgi:hypothetical protein